MIKSDRRADRYQAESRREKKKWNRICIMVFLGFLLLFGVIGLLIFLRPTRSAEEKRNLTSFPQLMASGIWDGSFFDGISKWYADTYPTRESMISAGNSLENIWGVRTAAIYNGNAAAATAGAGENAADGSADSTGSGTGESPTGTESVLASSAASSDSSDSGNLMDSGGGAIQMTPEVAGTIYVADGSGFELFYYNAEQTTHFAEMLNSVRDRLNDSVQLYAMPVPDAFGIMLSEDVQASLDAGSEKEAEKALFDQTGAGVHAVKLYDLLRSHNNEYIYFRTDHHWTQLGAYYAYCQFCKEKGIKAHSLDEYTKKDFGEFLGTFYTASNQAAELKKNADTLYAWVPLSTNDMKYTGTDGQTYDWKIIMDADDYDVGGKYSCFAAGDEPYAVIDNPKISDGSTCVVVKDSYADCFVPFLTDHYDKVYIMDYRYYNGDLTSFANSQKSCDVIILTSIVFAQSADRANMIEALFPDSSSQ